MTRVKFGEVGIMEFGLKCCLSLSGPFSVTVKLLMNDPAFIDSHITHGRQHDSKSAMATHRGSEGGFWGGAHSVIQE